MTMRNRLIRLANRLVAANQDNPLEALTDAEIAEEIRILEKMRAGQRLTADERKRYAIIEARPIPQRVADLSDEEVEAEIARLEALRDLPV